MMKKIICILALMSATASSFAQGSDATANMIASLERSIARSANKSASYDTLGMLHNALHNEHTQAGEKAKAAASFTAAERAFKMSLSLNPAGFDANYTLGALYYNRGLALTNQMLAEDDFSAAGKARYDALKKESEEWYKKSLPLFKKAESTAPNDVATLIALKNVFGQLNDEESLAIISKRYKYVTNGGEYTSSYYK